MGATSFAAMSFVALVVFSSNKPILQGMTSTRPKRETPSLEPFRWSSYQGAYGSKERGR
jgi:hypothetical protein